MTMLHLWALNSPFVQATFLGKTIKIIFMYLMAPLIVQNFKKIFRADPDLLT